MPRRTTELPERTANPLRGIRVEVQHQRIHRRRQVDHDQRSSVNVADAFALP
jgi:hypothetical protein